MNLNVALNSRLKLMNNKNNFIKCRDRYGAKFEISIDKLSFRPSVYCIIFKNDKILLSKQWDGYDFPGGGIKLGETIENALIRETREETGYRIKVGEIIACENSFFKYREKEKYAQSILIYRLGEIFDGEMSLEFVAESEKNYIDMPEWIDMGKITNIKFYNSVDSIKIIKRAFKIYNDNKKYE